MSTVNVHINNLDNLLSVLNLLKEKLTSGETVVLNYLTEGIIMENTIKFNLLEIIMEIIL